MMRREVAAAVIGGKLLNRNLILSYSKLISRAGRRARLTKVSLCLLDSGAFSCAERVLILLEITPLDGAHWPAWRNGRRGRLKIYYSRECKGSSPFAGICKFFYNVLRTLLSYLSIISPHFALTDNSGDCVFHTLWRVLVILQ